MRVCSLGKKMSRTAYLGTAFQLKPQWQEETKFTSVGGVDSSGRDSQSEFPKSYGPWEIRKSAAAAWKRQGRGWQRLAEGSHTQPASAGLDKNCETWL